VNIFKCGSTARGWFPAQIHTPKCIKTARYTLLYIVNPEGMLFGGEAIAICAGTSRIRLLVRKTLQKHFIQVLLKEVALALF
jgi:hypothetical protein